MKKLPLRSTNSRNVDINQISQMKGHQNYGVKVPNTVQLDLNSANIFEVLSLKQKENTARYQPQDGLSNNKSKQSFRKISSRKDQKKSIYTPRLRNFQRPKMSVTSDKFSKTPLPLLSSRSQNLLSKNNIDNKSPIMSSTEFKFKNPRDSL